MRWTTGHRGSRVARLLALVLGLWLALPGVPWAQPREPAPEARLIEVQGVINPASSRYLRRELRLADQAGAAAVIVQLDTPGGLDTSMREMTAAILDAGVPVAVYVAPSGARAASAGTFLTLAAHVAAMAPGTTIGAASPVAVGGGQTDATVADKAAADAAAFARSLAELRGRNAGWAERAVFESVSASADEALQLGVVDLVATDLDQLLQAMDGRTVTTSAGPVRLQTAGLPVIERSMTPIEQLMQAITDPNVAYVLFLVGIVGILAELYSPGALFPGIAGVICLLLAFVAFGSLPVSVVGVALLLLGIGLFVADLAVGGIGVLAVAAAIAFVLGSLLLYQPLTGPPPGMPAFRVSPWLVGVTALALGLLVFGVLQAVIRSRHEPIASGTEALIGQIGRALDDLAPEGPVRLQGELWTATAEGGPIPVGSEVEVLEVTGVTLRVRRVGPTRLADSRTPAPDDPRPGSTASRER